MTEIIDDRTEVEAGTGAAVTTAERVARWTKVCRIDRLTPGRGAAARVGERQVAVFRVREGEAERVYALCNRDPFSGAQVLSRGIVGDKAGVPKVASPVYKQAFDLRTGHCLDEPGVSVPTFPVTVTEDGWVSVGEPAP